MVLLARLPTTVLRSLRPKRTAANTDARISENPITPSSTNTIVHFYLDDQNQRSTLVPHSARCKTKARGGTRTHDLATPDGLLASKGVHQASLVLPCSSWDVSQGERTVDTWTRLSLSTPRSLSERGLTERPQNRNCDRTKLRNRTQTPDQDRSKNLTLKWV